MRARGTTANQTSYIDKSVVTGATYSYRVSAYVYGVAYGVPSNVASAKPLGNPLATPSALTATASSGRVALQWKDNAQGETGLSIERRLGNSGTWREIMRGAAPNQTRWIDSSVSAGVTYQYRVLAYKYGLPKGAPCHPVTVFVPLSSSVMSASTAPQKAPSGDGETASSDASTSSANGALKQPPLPPSGGNS